MIDIILKKQDFENNLAFKNPLIFKNALIIEVIEVKADMIIAVCLENNSIIEKEIIFHNSAITFKTVETIEDISTINQMYLYAYHLFSLSYNLDDIYINVFQKLKIKIANYVKNIRQLELLTQLQ